MILIKFYAIDVSNIHLFLFVGTLLFNVNRLKIILQIQLAHK